MGGVETSSVCKLPQAFSGTGVSKMLFIGDAERVPPVPVRNEEQILVMGRPQSRQNRRPPGIVDGTRRQS